MCVRFYVDPIYSIIQKAQKTKIAKEMMVKIGKPQTMCGDIRPTDIAAVLAPTPENRIAAFPMIWGFTFKAERNPIVNCRVETAKNKGLWQESWHKRRCVIPASWYYEWTHTKQKYVIQPKGDDHAFIAGLYRYEEHCGMNVPMFSILTRSSVNDLKDIHERMPIILPQDCIVDWISPFKNPEIVLNKQITEFVFEKAE